MKIYQFLILFLLILVPLMAIFSIMSYKLDQSIDISSVKCIALIASLFNLFLAVLLLTNYDFDLLGYQFITDLTTSFTKLNQSNIQIIKFIDSLLNLDLYNNFEYYYSHFGFKALNFMNWLCENFPGFNYYQEFNPQYVAEQYITHTHIFTRDIIQNISSIPSFLKSIKVGVDEKSLFFILLTTFITPICILANWSDIQEMGKLKLFLILFLLLEILQIALFLVLDLFWFYIFFESVLIPLFLLIII
jgi:NADH:ubiquinone oxidoreductase subunit 4 (subunit M)